MNAAALTPYLERTLDYPDPHAIKARSHTRGKVREIWDLGSSLLILTTDRVSAFDHVLTTIPCKGEILNQISLFWFDKTRDIVANHVLATPSARSVLVEKAAVVPIEVVVRGYLTGSAWRDYQKTGVVSGIALPKGMRQNQRFPEPLLTPSTKEEEGHDRPISSEAIVSEGIVAADLWSQIETVARSLFARGTELLAERGMILVDTKYELGLVDGNLMLIDEVHTPDSSRFWYSESYQERFDRDEAQRQLDKEHFRRWLMDQGYMGDGAPPDIPDEIRLETGLRYVEAFEAITGRDFEPRSGTLDEEFQAISRHISAR